MPLTVAGSLAYLAISVRFWFWGPTTIIAFATICFTAAYVLESSA